MKDKLPKAFKKKWVAALRSGKYEQGRTYLFNENHNNYCCLGVACVVSGKNPEAYWAYIDKSHNKNGKIPTILIGAGDTPSTLSRFNDLGKSFNWIASYIERYL